MLVTAFCSSKDGAAT